MHLFFVGFFFLICGYFVEKSYDHRGAWPFIKPRLIRLGIPLLFLVVFAFGAISYGDADTKLSFFPYLISHYLGGGNYELGPLWFVAHLLVYQLTYVLWRTLTGSVQRKKQTPQSLPSHSQVLIFCLVLGTVSALVTLYYPQNR